MKTVRVVAAVIIDEVGRILVAQRPYSELAYKSFKWEFPGGKVEENENCEEALIREILEELDCKIIIQNKLGDVEYEYPDFKLSMELFICRLHQDSSPKSSEHEQIKWISGEEINKLDWLEADYKILPIIKAYLNYNYN